MNCHRGTITLDTWREVIIMSTEEMSVTTGLILARKKTTETVAAVTDLLGK